MSNSNINSMQLPVYHPRQPLTPGPKSLNSIEQDWKIRFAGIMFLCKDKDTEIDDCFIEYDHYELYSEKKHYSRRIYSAAYKGIMKEYRSHLCIVSMEDTDENVENYYVVAKKVKSEIEYLEKFCPCITCTASIVNPIKYIWCPQCTKCIKSGKGFTTLTNIELAKKNKEIFEAGKVKLNTYYLEYIVPACTVLIGLFYLW